MTKYTLNDIRRIEKQFIPCPFCGQKPTIIFTDDEGNWKDQQSEEYLDDPWSGLSFSICHDNEDCPISPCEMDCGFPIYGAYYDSPEEAVNDWNESLTKK